MKKIILFCSFLCVLVFCYGYTSLAFEIDIPSQNIQNTLNENSLENVSVESPAPVVTEVSQSQKDELLTPTNIINIILIVVGIVLILLGIAILIRCK